METNLEDRLSGRIGGALGLKIGANAMVLARSDRKRMGASLIHNLTSKRLLSPADVHRAVPRRTWIRRKAEGGLTSAEFDA